MKKIRRNNHPDSTCAHCGKAISTGKAGRRRYCGDAHKQAAYRIRKRKE